MRVIPDLMTSRLGRRTDESPRCGQLHSLLLEDASKFMIVPQATARVWGAAMTPTLGIAFASSLLLVVSGCGASDSHPQKDTNSTPESAASGRVVEAHYFIGYGEGDVYDPRAGKADVLTDGVRYRILVTGNAPEYAGFRELFVFDGHRLFADDSDSSPQYVLYEAPQEHPDVLGFGSGLIFDAHMSPWNQMCGQDPPVPTLSRTVLGRDARLYECPQRTKAPGIWVDEASSLLLRLGASKARNLTVNPPISAKTFSTKPPAGIDVQVVPAQ